MLECSIQADSAGDCDRYGYERHCSHCAEETQCDGLEADFLRRERLDRDDEHPQILHEPGPRLREVGHVLVPYILGHIVPEPSYFRSDSHFKILNHSTEEVGREVLLTFIEIALPAFVRFCIGLWRITRQH